MGPDSGSSDGATCPVDHKSRQAWLDKARSAPHPPPPPPSATPQIPRTYYSLDHSRYLPLVPSRSFRPSLGQDREISTIPRAATASGPGGHTPNSETETGASPDGHWVYPSEQQFFDALRRKHLPAEQADMRNVVPIHNAVNERAWAEIRAWENGRGADPKLVSFSGDSTRRTPRAWWNGVMGYREPFDRHDWIVDRGGTRVDYVIDFYQGKEEREGMLNFYLDVRPKLNTLEGWRMRAGRFLGW